MIEYIKKDFEKYCLIKFHTANPSFTEKIRLWMDEFGLHCTTVYRLGQFGTHLLAANNPFAIPVLVAYYLLNIPIRCVHHVYIDRQAEIQAGFYISHVGTIYIGDIKIGSNFSVTHNVTVGKGHTKLGVSAPAGIGNNVWIGTGTVLAGDISIGNDVTIMPLSLVTKSIPDGKLVGGNPSRVILTEYSNQHLFGDRHL